MKPKRSQSIALVMMGVSAIVLSACEEKQVDAMVYENLQQCINDPMMQRDQCEANFAAAQAQHTKVSPKYTSRADCEADFGANQCEDAPGYRTREGGSIFMPVMMGYMMGSMLGGRGVASQPLYRSTDDPKNYRTADNRKVGGQTGATKVAQSAARSPSVKTSTVRRGGFGARARSYGATGLG